MAKGFYDLRGSLELDRHATVEKIGEAGDPAVPVASGTGDSRNRSALFFVEPLQQPRKEANVSILWIILIVVLVLALLGFVGRSF